MLSYLCTCGETLIFDDRVCAGCGSQIGYDPIDMRLGPLQQRPGGVWSLQGDERRGPPAFRFCAHREAAAACNWLVPAEEPGSLCRACGTTRTIPDLSRPRNAERLRKLEGAKRRVLFNVQAAGLPVVPRSAEPQHGLAFDFLEALDGGPGVTTGHASGVVTINVEEADDDYRERHRGALGEPYRTVVGHIRHELGHYYWDIVICGGPWLEPFRALFGDERADYAEALRLHYENGSPADWKQRHISSYAASHPWEDWAETFAHYLHARSTLETAASFKLDTSGMKLGITPFGPEHLYSQEPEAGGEAFLGWLNAWLALTTVLNETARSMGQPDLYPFTLTGPVVTKLHFAHCAICGDRVNATAVPPPHLQVPPSRD